MIKNIDLCKRFINEHCIITSFVNYPVTNFYINRINQIYGSNVKNQDFIFACNELNIKHRSIKHRDLKGKTTYKSNLYALRIKHWY